jgi:predicted nuclease of predicted toxin-antitoxin system
MKLLFDQNISYRIQRLLPDIFSDCCHVKTVRLNDCNDILIWQFAKQNDYTIVTFDADFFDISLLNGFPPKIIWLRTGNLTTFEIAERIIINYSKISSFIEKVDESCLEIY